MTLYTVALEKDKMKDGIKNLKQHEEVDVKEELSFNAYQVTSSLSTDELQEIRGVRAANKEGSIEFGV